MTATIQNFCSEETWLGGFYEIEFELGVSSDDRLRLALQTVWTHPTLEGCYLRREREPQAQVRVNPRQYATERHLYGIAKLPDGATAACGTYVYRLRDKNGSLLSDFLGFYAPHGALSRTYGIPSERFDGYLWPIGQRLEWYPPTNWQLASFPDSDSPTAKRSTPSSNPRT